MAQDTPTKAKRIVRPASGPPVASVSPLGASNGTLNGVKNGHIAAIAAPSAPGAVAAPVRAPDVYNPQCPAQKALETIASKWAILIMHKLLASPMRFNALQRELSGISQKVLTQQLRRLEKYGLVTRTVHPTVPPSVEYALTSAGRELKDALGSLCQWATKHAVLLGLPAQTK